jgi:hypothetical protein
MAQVSIGIALPGVSIGINQSMFPEMVQVPGYPVYYAPQLNSNFFFYDGMYWVYQGDNWYASSWYNGPWGLVGPEFVPLFILRIPVRYYRFPPAYFYGWRPDAPPRWGEYWGNDWAQHRSGWDRWNRNATPAPAPLPLYQRQYSGNRYPQVEQQHTIRNQNYRYQPRDAVVQQHYQAPAVQRAPAPVSVPALAPAPVQRGPQGAPQERSPRPQDIQRSNPPPQLKQAGPTVQRPQPPQQADQEVARPTPTQGPARHPAGQDQRTQPQLQLPQWQGQQQQGQQQQQQQGQGPEKDREERGPGRNR